MFTYWILNRGYIIEHRIGDILGVHIFDTGKLNFKSGLNFAEDEFKVEGICHSRLFEVIWGGFRLVFFNKDF